jgi:hypothetical protein
MNHPRLRLLVVVALLLVLASVWPAGQATMERQAPRIDRPTEEGENDLPDIQPSPAQQSAAKDLLRVFVIQLEEYQAHPERRGDAALQGISHVLQRADPKARTRLLEGIGRFTVKPEVAKQQFFGTLYAPTVEARAALVPKALSLVRAQPLTVKPLLIPPKRNRAPQILPAQFTAPAKAAAGYNYARLVLRRIDVRSQNDDNSEDEIYFGLCNFGALQPTYFKTPKNADGYWTVRGTGATSPNVGLVKFTAPKDPFWVNSVISVFEEDDGTWNEIAPLLITAASYALEGYLASEIGAVLAEIVMSFIDELFEWFEDLITNDDDYIGTFATKALIFRGKVKWTETGTRISRDKSFTVIGEDANYRITVYWELVT